MSGLQNPFKKAVATSLLHRSGAVREFHDFKVPDPYQYLDELESSVTLAFRDFKENEFQSFIGDRAGRKAAEQKLEEGMKLPAKGIPQRAGEHYLFYNRSPDEKQPKIMVSDTAEGAGRVLVDAGDFGPPGAKEIVGASISPDGKYLAYRIATPGKAWEADLRIKDIATGKDLPDVVHKNGSMWWDKDGKGLVYNTSGEGQRVKLMHHALGTPQASDTVFDENKTSPTASSMLSHSRFYNHAAYDGEQEWLFRSEHFSAAPGLCLKDKESGEYKTILEPGIADCVPIADTGEGVLMWTSHGAPNGKVILMDLQNPAPENWKTVIPEHETDALQHAFPHKGRVFCLYNHNCAEELRIFDRKGNATGEIPLNGPSKIMLAHGSLPGLSLGLGATRPDGEDLFMQVSTFTGPPAIYRYNLEDNSFQPVDPPPPNAPDLSGCIVEQLWATSKDGTQIPMTVIRKPGVELDGTASLKQEGYGGFKGLGMGPHINAEMVDHIMAGGIYVLANIRGGGEFGQDWHDQGRLLNKQNSFDDFIACSKLLCEKKYTSPERLTITGHSNGGLLALACMQKEPGLFGAVIASCPVADMFSDKLRPMHNEYGDPAEEHHFRNLMGYDPVQNVRSGVKYPPLLLATAGKDTDLLGGAYKFIATMQHASPESLALLHVEKGFGHVPERPTDIAAKEIAARRAFMEKCTGPVDQNEYKRQLAMGASFGLKNRSPASRATTGAGPAG